MKQAILIFSFLTFALPFVHAQSSAEIHRKVYKQSLERGDLNAATVAVQYLIADGSVEGNWEDTLARLYFSSGQYPLARNISEKLLKSDPSSVPMLTIAAYSNKSLGLTKEAIPFFESLYAKTGHAGSLYELISLQFTLKRYGEAADNIEILLKDPKASEAKTLIQVGNGPGQEVPLNVAALNIKGVIALELGNEEDAMRIFNEALELMPEFALAKQNLAVLKAKAEQDESKEESPADQPETRKGKKKK